MDALNHKHEFLIQQTLNEKQIFVWGRGPRDAKLMFIGEAPGKDELKLSQPFVGKAGKNLNSFFEILELNRNKCYITNVVKIRPVTTNQKTGRINNRPPRKEEIILFGDWLQDEIRTVAPKLIITLGNTALQAVYDPKAKISDCHGKLLKKDGRYLYPLYHPAAVIYNQHLKTDYQNDLKNLKTDILSKKIEELLLFFY